MSSVAGQSKEELDRVLECSICLSNFRKPKQLPCLHSFCQGCLEKYCDFQDDDRIPCPLCKGEFSLPQGGVEALYDSELINRLMLQRELTDNNGTKPSVCEPCMDIGEETEADSFCLECRQCLCRRCKMLHAKGKCTSHHKIVSNDEKPTDEELQRLMSCYCSKHSNKEIELYCCDCSMLICFLCLATNHSRHICKVPEDIAGELKELLAADRNVILKCRSEVGERSQKQIKEHQDSLQKILTTESAVREKLATIRKLLENYETEMLKKLQGIKKNTLKEMESQKDVDELHLVGLDGFLSYSRMMTERGTDCEIIRAAADLHKRAEELINDQKEKDTVVKVKKYLHYTESPTMSSQDMDKLVGKISHLPADFEAFLNSRCTAKIIEHTSQRVTGITAMGNEIFVVRSDQSEVQIYDSHSLTASRCINIRGMKSPTGLAGCSHENALYVSDNELKYLHRVDLNNNSVTGWKMRENHKPCGVSVTAEHTLLVTVSITQNGSESGVLEYTSGGQERREIRFDKSIPYARQTVQLSSDQFIVSCRPNFVGFVRDLKGVCLINSQGQIVKSDSRGEGQLDIPRSLSFDNNSKHIFVADINRIILLDADLSFVGQVYGSPNRSSLSCLYFDSSTSRLFVGESSREGNHLLVISLP